MRLTFDLTCANRVSTDLAVNAYPMDRERLSIESKSGKEMVRRDQFDKWKVLQLTFHLQVGKYEE